MISQEHAQQQKSIINVTAYEEALFSTLRELLSVHLKTFQDFAHTPGFTDVFELI